MRRPWFKFWPADWAGDRKLHGCSLAARGLWIELCCLMHEGSPYGHLAFAGGPMPLERIARQVGCTKAELAPLLVELEDSGVFSRTPDGTLFSRRMVRDEELRGEGATNGKRGGNPRLVITDGIKGGDNPPGYPGAQPVGLPSGQGGGQPRAEHLASSGSSRSSLPSEDQPHTDTPSLRSGVGAVAPETPNRAGKTSAEHDPDSRTGGLPGIEIRPPKGKREPTQGQIDGFVARGVWQRCWTARFGKPYAGLSGKKSSAVRYAFVRLGRDEGELERVLRAFLANPPYKHQENPDPIAFLDSLDAVRAGLNGKARGHRPTARERQDAELQASLEEVRKVFHPEEFQDVSA